MQAHDIEIGKLYRFQSRETDTLWAVYVNAGFSADNRVLYVLMLLWSDTSKQMVMSREDFLSFMDGIFDTNICIGVWSLSNLESINEL